jgi:hypothetical protein
VFHSQVGLRFSFFLITTYIMAMETVKFNLFLSLSVYLFSFFLYSHLKTTGEQLLSQHVMAKIKSLLCNILSECLTDNLTNSFHILTQRFVLFFHDSRVPHKVCVCNCLENSTLSGQPLAQETTKMQSVACQLVSEQTETNVIFYSQFTLLNIDSCTKVMCLWNSHCHHNCSVERCVNSVSSSLMFTNRLLKQDF